MKLHGCFSWFLASSLSFIRFNFQTKTYTLQLHLFPHNPIIDFSLKHNIRLRLGHYRDPIYHLVGSTRLSKNMDLDMDVYPHPTIILDTFFTHEIGKFHYCGKLSCDSK